MNKVKITSIRQASAEEWDKHWINCAYATYFQSREWTEIWEAYSEGSLIANAEHFVFSDGKEAILPASIVKMHKGLGKKYIMSAAGTFGGWISADDLQYEHSLLLYNLIKNRNVLWRLNPYDPNHVNIKEEVIKKKDVTHTLPLQKDFEQIFRQWSNNHKRAVKKGIKEGVIIKIAETHQEWLDYFEIYQKSLERWGENTSSQYSWELFNQIYLTKSGNVKLWLACYEERVIAGALCFYASKHVVYWHGAADEDYFKVKPVQTLFYSCIKDACEKGYSWFDFNPSGGHEGVKKFKSGFATVEEECHVVDSATFTYKFINKIANLTV